MNHTSARAALLAVGAVAAGTGSTVAVRGTAAIPGGAPTTGSNDSVLRFYAVWWAAQGVTAVNLARDPDLDLDDPALRSLCATTFVGGLARIAAARTSGRPHPLFQVLTVMEVLGPLVLVGLRRRNADPRVLRRPGRS